MTAAPDARVSDLCVRNVIVAKPGDPVRDAARRMVEGEVGTLVVVDDERRPLGILTDRDVMARCVARGVDPAGLRVSRIMSAPAVWVREDAGLAQALDEMARLGVRRLPVVDARDRLVGLLALDDALCRALDAGSPLGRALRASLGETVDGSERP
jgi:CBS domain-containing protein